MGTANSKFEIRNSKSVPAFRIPNSEFRIQPVPTAILAEMPMMRTMTGRRTGCE